jgi:hypothetical protein
MRRDERAALHLPVNGHLKDFVLPGEVLFEKRF